MFRAGLNRWLLGLGWPATDRQDAVLAINEACDNSVRQAGFRGDPGEVEVVARLVIGVDGRRIVAIVRDQAVACGRRGRRRHVADDRERLHGPRTDPATGGGTCVTMTSRPVPLRIAWNPAVDE